MRYRWLLNPKFLLFAPLALLLVVAVACGEDSTPTSPAPTATSPAPTATSPEPTEAGPAATAPSTAPTAMSTEVMAPSPTAMPMMTEPPIDIGVAVYGDAVALAERYDGTTPRYGGKFLNVFNHNVTGHDYHQHVGGVQQSLPQLLNGLIWLNPYDWQEIVPDLAYFWEVSDDGLSYTFHLNEGVTWHDGMPFTSADVKYSYDRIINNGKVAGNTGEGAEEGNFNNTPWVYLIDNVEAPDPLTVVVNVKGPTPAVLDVLGDGYAKIIPKHISEVDPVHAVSDDLKPIGTGPFRLTEPVTIQLWKMERNPDYFKPGRPFLDAIDTHQILDTQTRLAAVLTERVFWTDNGTIPTLKYSELKAIADRDPGVIHYAFPTFYYFGFWMNTTRKPFDDIRVRQAFAEAIDKTQFFVEGVGDQRGVLGTATYPLGKWALPQERVEKLPGYGTDMEARRQNARDLLADYEAENGEIDWSKVPYSIPTQHVGEFNGPIIQGMMKQVGVDLVLDPMEIMTAWGNNISGDFNMNGMFSIIDFDDPISHFTTTYITGSLWGFHRLFDTRIDQLFQDQLYLSDQEERKRIAWEIDEWAMTQSMNLVLYWGKAENIRRDYVMGWHDAPGYRTDIARMETIWLDLDELPKATQ